MGLLFIQRIFFVGVLMVLSSSVLIAQDEFILMDDTIRVGELEWDIHKDWRSRKDLIAKHPELYGEHVRIKLSYHRNKMVHEIVFGYVSEDSGFVAHGPARYYYDQGQLLGKRHFRLGVLEGDAFDYFPDGSIRVKTKFDSGLLQGSFTSFYQNGTTEMVGQYREGMPHGKQEAWYSNGNRKWVESYEHGVRMGPDSSFYENGSLEATASYREGLADGKWIFYHRDGAVWTEREYAAGRLMSVGFIQSKEGRQLEVGSFKDGNGWLRIYSEAGLPVEQEFYKEGRLTRVRPFRK
jgi:antitoxin component YwqK of YwqJK toxin-antitoxin module